MEMDSIVPGHLRPLYFNPLSPYDCGCDYTRGGAGGEDAVTATAEEATAAATASTRVQGRGTEWERES
jgi:hypothetical protein